MVTCKYPDHTNLIDIFQGAPKSTSRLATPRDFLVIVMKFESKEGNLKNENLRMITENCFSQSLFRVKVLFVKSSHNDDPPASKTCSLTGSQELNGEKAGLFGKVSDITNLSLLFVTCTLVTNPGRPPSGPR